MNKCNRCTNKGKDCYRCFQKDGYPFFREKAKRPSSFRKTKSKKEGMAFQRAVVKEYNDKMGSLGKEAREQPNSGAIWHMPGDVIAEEALIECKERGSLSAKGEKQISIKKDWLDKASEEAFLKDRPMLLSFGFKNDDEIYIIGKFNLFLELVQTISILKNRIKELEGK